MVNTALLKSKERFPPIHHAEPERMWKIKQNLTSASQIHNMLDSYINITTMVLADNFSKYLHDFTQETILRQEHKDTD